MRVYCTSYIDQEAGKPVGSRYNVVYHEYNVQQICRKNWVVSAEQLKRSVRAGTFF